METAQLSRETTEFTAAAAAEDWSARETPEPSPSIPLAGLAYCPWPELNADVDRDASAADPRPGHTVVQLRVVLGRVRRIQDRATPPAVGHVVVLDEHSTALVEILEQGRVLARGHLRSLDGCYCVQITELVRAPDAVGGPVRTPQNSGSTP